MTNDEQELLSAVFDLAGGKAAVVPFDQVAARLGTTLAVAKTIAALLRSRNLALVTFGGIQLTGSGLHYAQSERQEGSADVPERR